MAFQGMTLFPRDLLRKGDVYDYKKLLMTLNHQRRRLHVYSVP